jgi:hypothetical protein
MDLTRYRSRVRAAGLIRFALSSSIFVILQSEILDTCLERSRIAFLVPLWQHLAHHRPRRTAWAIFRAKATNLFQPHPKIVSAVKGQELGAIDFARAEMRCCWRSTFYKAKSRKPQVCVPQRGLSDPDQNRSVALLTLLTSSATARYISHCKTCEFLKKTVTPMRKRL